jgi:hypothetical protein
VVRGVPPGARAGDPGLAAELATPMMPAVVLLVRDPRTIARRQDAGRLS